jgi:hypothetical protein
MLGNYPIVFLTVKAKQIEGRLLMSPAEAKVKLHTGKNPSPRWEKF